MQTGTPATCEFIFILSEKKIKYQVDMREIFMNLFHFLLLLCFSAYKLAEEVGNLINQM